MGLSEGEILKIELMCRGIKLGSFRNSFTRYRYKRASLSEGLYFRIKRDGEILSANIPAFEPFVEGSPFYYDHKRGEIYRGEEKVGEGDIIPDPPWYRKLLPDGREFQSILQQHGEDILALAITSRCWFKSEGRGCLFCALEPRGEAKNPEDVRYVIRRLKEEGYSYKELNINSGTIKEKDFGVEFYAAMACAGRDEGLRVYVQIPPISEDGMKLLRDSGVSSISMNLEIFNDRIRKEICPAKSEISKGTYLSALERAVKIFGDGQVSSWLIIGLEPEEDTMRGIDAILETGAIPYPSVFRPLKGSPLEKLLPPSPEIAVRIYSYLREKLEKRKEILGSRAGCVNCGCCSVLPSFDL